MYPGWGILSVAEVTPAHCTHLEHVVFAYAHLMDHGSACPAHQLPHSPAGSIGRGGWFPGSR